MSGFRTGDRVLVTGATGFIGRVLCEQLQASGVVVRALARTRAVGPWDELVIADLGRTGAIPADAFAGIDTVFHLAGRAHAHGESNRDEELYLRINVDGTRAVARACVEQGVNSLVFFSSIKAMGEGGASAVRETDAVKPETPYGRSKLLAESVVLDTVGQGVHAVVLRLPVVYGPGMGGNLGRMRAGIQRGWFPALSVPPNVRSMIDVRDVAAAALHVAREQRARGRIYLVTDGEGYSTERVDRALRASLGAPDARVRLPWAVLRFVAWLGDLARVLTGRRFPFDSASLRALSGSAVYDSSRIRDELGFESRWTLETALGERGEPAC